MILAIDTSEFHSGTRSLSVTFDGQSASEEGISQFIPVNPNTGYEFSAEYRTEELETASGPRFAITDAMGRRGKERLEREFSYEKFRARLERVLC